MHKQRLGIVAGAAIGIIATFLPWATNVPLIGTVNGTKGDGFISMLLCLIPLVIAVLGDRSTALAKGKFIITLAAGVLVLLFGIYEYSNISSAAKAFEALGMKAEIGIGIGVWLVIVSGAVIAATAFALKGATNDSTPTA
ncbi:MAG: hypothetical protein KF690_12180 [Bacteroidetes bacterium]|nr:hypothetical protein [Bacteroidota bacterium]